MTDATTNVAPPADDSASDADKSDEQLWDELKTQETDADPDADDADATKADADDAGGADDADATKKAGADDAGDPDPGKPDDPSPSDDTDTGDGPDGSTDGQDLEALQAQNTRLLKALDSEKGRAAGGRREIVKLRSQIASAPDPKAQSDDSDDAHLKERREKLEASREEYGDVIGPLAEEITAINARLDEDKAQKATDLEQRKRRYNDLVTAEVRVFEVEHKDGFDTIVKNREVFDAWIDDQPRALRDIYADNQQDIIDGTQAAYLVTLFKQALLDASDDPAPANPDTERLQSRRQRQLAGARSLRTPGNTPASSEPAQGSGDDQGHWDYWKRKEQREDAAKR